MTYDRFDAALRRHLLETADERPADGQLAAVVEAVAETRQRPSLVARLNWVPGRVGPVPSVAIRYGLIGVALLLAALAGALLAGGGATPAASTVFEGTWTSIDRADRSGQTLVVGPGDTPSLYFEDGYASGAACVADEVKRFTARGTGEIEGNRLVAKFPDGGGCGTRTVPVGGYFVHDPRSDTLFGHDGTVWSRALAAVPPPTPAPSTDVSPTESPAEEPTPDESAQGPTGVPECIQFDAGGTYGSTLGDLALTVTVPATGTWHGLGEAFYLLRAPCLLDGPAQIEASVLEWVFLDACRSNGDAVQVDSAATAAEALGAQAGHAVAGPPTEVTLDGRTGVKVELTVPAEVDASACDDGVLRLWHPSPEVDPGSAISVYLVDVDGLIVAITAALAPGGEEETTTLRAEVDAMVGSLEIR